MRAKYMDEVDAFFDALPDAAFESIGCVFCAPRTPSMLLFSKGTMRVFRCECGFVFNARQPTQKTLTEFYARSSAMESWAYIKSSAGELARQTEKFAGPIREIAASGAK